MSKEGKERNESLLQKAKSYEQLDEEIRAFLFPKLVILLRSGKINGGKYPKKKDDDIITIREFGTKKNGELYVLLDIHWCGDVYDYDSVSMTEEEWSCLTLLKKE